MPKSKRDRTVSLTVTKKKGLELKQNLITEIRDTLDKYDNLFVISMFNQRNLFLKELRAKFSDSKFLFGKNKVITLALGRGKESETKENLHKITPYLSGTIGLLFTNRTKDEIIKYFNEYSCPDYARSGNIATEDVVISAGPLENFQHTMEPQLRKLGLHTSLKKGVVTLDTDYKICKKGDKLTPDQARLLKLFDYLQATFKINVKVHWNKSGEYEIIDKTLEESVEVDSDDDDDADADDGDDHEEEILIESQENVKDDDDDEDEPKHKKLRKKDKNKKKPSPDENQMDN